MTAAKQGTPKNIGEALEWMRFGCPFKPNERGVVVGDYDVPYFERRMLAAADYLERELSRVAELERAAPQDDPNFKIQAATQVPGYYSAAGVEEPGLVRLMRDFKERHPEVQIKEPWQEVFTYIDALRALLEASLKREREALEAVRDADSYLGWDTFDQREWEKKHAAVISRASGKERG